MHPDPAEGEARITAGDRADGLREVDRRLTELAGSEAAGLEVLEELGAPLVRRVDEVVNVSCERVRIVRTAIA